MFQFTQPKRAATMRLGELVPVLCVSIHAAQAGCDGHGQQDLRAEFLFQFTQPKRAATLIANIINFKRLVSIHAAQAGCDHRCDRSR